MLFLTALDVLRKTHLPGETSWPTALTYRTANPAAPNQAPGIVTLLGRLRRSFSVLVGVPTQVRVGGRRRVHWDTTRIGCRIAATRRMRGQTQSLISTF